MSEEDLNRIQVECMRAYPRDLILEMNGDRARMPAELEREPDEIWEHLYPVGMEKGEFYPTILQEILPMFRLYVKPGIRFLDLGSGDGRVVFLANALGADAYGIEYEEKLIQTSIRAQRAIRDILESERIHFTHGDFFEASWSGYDVIYYFAPSSFEQERFHHKLVSELKPGARVIVGRAPGLLEGLELEDEAPAVKVFKKPAK